jgi:hypothetical protein
LIDVVAEGCDEDLFRVAALADAAVLEIGTQALCRRDSRPRRGSSRAGVGVDGWQKRAELIMRSPQAHHA